MVALIAIALMLVIVWHEMFATKKELFEHKVQMQILLMQLELKEITHAIWIFQIQAQNGIISEEDAQKNIEVFYQHQQYVAKWLNENAYGVENEENKANNQ
jgi:hypothetical protein